MHVAPPDTHLLLEHGQLRLDRGEPEGGHRPSIDALLRSAALDAGPRVVGVVLTGRLADGSEGLAAVAGHGGEALVQDPEEAEFASMPVSALAAVPTARALGLDALAEELVRLTSSARHGALIAGAPRVPR